MRRSTELSDILRDIPVKWGLRKMITEIYNFLPPIYKRTITYIHFTEPNQLSFLWEEMYNDHKYVTDADGRRGEQYLRISDILSIMNNYVKVVTFDMNAMAYADINFTETGPADENVELSFEFEIQPY